MAIIGSVHMTTRRDFSHLVQKIRGVLVQECGLDMPISTLQTFCLCHVHDTWYSTAESQFVAQCMWPVMVAHSRKKGIGVVGKPENEIHQEEAWAAWAKEEGESETLKQNTDIQNDDALHTAFSSLIPNFPPFGTNIALVNYPFSLITSPCHVHVVNGRHLPLRNGFACEAHPQAHRLHLESPMLVPVISRDYIPSSRSLQFQMVTHPLSSRPWRWRNCLSKSIWKTV